MIFIEGDKDSIPSIFYVPFGFNSIYLRANFNVMEVGGIEVRFVKDLDFENEIIFWLDDLEAHYKKL